MFYQIILLIMENCMLYVLLHTKNLFGRVTIFMQL